MIGLTEKSLSLRTICEEGHLCTQQEQGKRYAIPWSVLTRWAGDATSGM